MLPFELVATATDSPRDSPAGSLRKFGTAVNGISGTPVIVAFCWADAEPARSRTAAHVQERCRVMARSLHHRSRSFKSRSSDGEALGGPISQEEHDVPLRRRRARVENRHCRFSSAFRGPQVQVHSCETRPHAPPSFASLIWRSGPAARLRPTRVPLVGLGANPTLALRRFLFREDFANSRPKRSRLTYSYTGI